MQIATHFLFLRARGELTGHNFVCTTRVVTSLVLAASEQRTTPWNTRRPGDARHLRRLHHLHDACLVGRCRGLWNVLQQRRRRVHQRFVPSFSNFSSVLLSKNPQEGMNLHKVPGTRYRVRGTRYKNSLHKLCTEHREPNSCPQHGQGGESTQCHRLAGG